MALLNNINCEWQSSPFADGVCIMGIDSRGLWGLKAPPPPPPPKIFRLYIILYIGMAKILKLGQILVVNNLKLRVMNPKNAPKFN